MNLRQRRDYYQRLITEALGLEEQFAALSRDYDNAQIRYRELKEKKLSADMSEQVDQGRIGQRLEIVEPPELPTNTTPSKSKLLILGTVLSVFGGAGGSGSEALSCTVCGNSATVPA